eukprot:gene23281-18702_t
MHTVFFLYYNRVTCNGRDWARAGWEGFGWSATAH